MMTFVVRMLNCRKGHMNKYGGVSLMIAESMLSPTNTTGSNKQ